MHLKSVCLIASGIAERTSRLQPWRYLTEVVCQLAALGHPMTLLSEGDEALPTRVLESQVYVQRVPSVKNPVWKPNHLLLEAIHEAAPEIIIWHLGLTSLLYQNIPSSLNVPIIGIFSSPIYHPGELVRLGPRKLIEGYYISGTHLVGSLTPDWFLRVVTRRNKIDALVVQTNTTRKSLEQAGLWRKDIHVIPPGVDERWLAAGCHEAAEMRSSWGFDQKDLVLLFYGSPAELRGLPTLVKAFVDSHHSLNNLKLVMLCRKRPTDWVREEHMINKLVQDHHLEADVKITNGYLEPAAVVNSVAAADIVALPFELLPSDAPLSILEALALGKPVITTRVACLPELVSNGKGYLAEPGDANSLSQAIEQAADQLIHAEETSPGPQKHPTRSWQTMGEEWSQILQSL